MKTATVKELKQELSHQSHAELLEICLSLSKFKKENKELLTYILYEADYEEGYIKSVQIEVEDQFKMININSYYYIKKSVRKILRTVKKYIRYSKKKETEVELLLHFCSELKKMKPSMQGNVSLQNIFNRQIDLIRKTMLTLHEDLQYDYELTLNKLL